MKHVSYCDYTTKFKQDKIISVHLKRKRDQACKGFNNTVVNAIHHVRVLLENVCKRLGHSPASKAVLHLPEAVNTSRARPDNRPVSGRSYFAQARSIFLAGARFTTPEGAQRAQNSAHPY